MPTWSRYNTLVPTDDYRAFFFNARTGALICLSKERKEQVENFEPEFLDEEFADFLLTQGFLAREEVDEITLIIEAHEKARTNPSIFSATIELTDACNFRCRYCYQAHAAEHLEEDVTNRIVRYLSRKMAEVRHLHVNWFGGEPLLRLKTMAAISQKLTEEARLTGCRFSQFITTNGYLLTPNVAKQLVELGIENVQITVDGDEESHNRLRVLASGRGTYRRVLEACANVVSAGMELMVRINVNRWNSQRINGLLSDLVSHGISHENTVIHVVRTVNHGTCDELTSRIIFSNADFARERIAILRVIASYGFGLPSLDPIAYNCTFDLQQTVMIGRDGAIRHCSSSDGRLAELDETGHEINRTMLYDTIKHRRPTDDPNCRACKHLPMCMGGCSYLQEIGQEKCNPERHVLNELISLIGQRSLAARA